MDPADLRSNFNLQMMNLFLGMCRGVAGLPRDLRDLGYRDKWVEFKFANSRGEAVVPELVIASGRLKHTMLLEWKSGQNTDGDQLRRYAGVTPEDLRTRALLTAEESHAHDVVLIGLAEYEDRLVIAIDRDHHPFPVLVRDAEGLVPVRNGFRVGEADGVFRPKLLVDWGGVPTFLYPLDVASETWEFAEMVIPKVLEQMAQGAPRILLKEVAQAVVPCWGVVDRQHQQELEKKMFGVMDCACRRDFRAFFRRNKTAGSRTHTPTWDVVSNPLAGAPDRRQREWRGMRKRQEALIDFLRTGREVPEQGELELGEGPGL